MDTKKNTFYDANASRSQSIYQKFYNGAVINRKEYIEAKADFIEAADYREIAVNENHYRQLYWHLGYNLSLDEGGEYYYLKSISENDADTESFDETSLKIMAILTIIARLANNRSQTIESLIQPVQGISQADLNALDEDSETLAILKSLKMKDSSDAINFLRKRGFAFKVDSKRSVLSKGASTMIDTIIDRQKALIGDSAVNN